MDPMENNGGTSDNDDDANKEGAEKKVKKALEAKKSVKQLNFQLRQLKLFQGQVVAPMGQAADKDKLHHDADAEPQIESMEVADECSSSNDPPQLQRPSSIESTAFSLSAQKYKYILSTKTPGPGPKLQQMKQQFQLPDLPPATELSKFIEARVNGILRGNNAQRVFVREIHCEPMLFTPTTELQGFLEQFIPEEIIYTQRSLMCFQRTATGCVMFFYLCVQEYDKTCPPPYQNTAYIAMLDSVRLFEPSCKRKHIYNCILLSYLQYLREVGFKNAFLWACPPRPEEEYVFNQRPTSQKTPTEPILIEWYTNMMKAGMKTGVLKSYSTLYDWCPKKAKEFFTTFAYYPGDHWLEQMNETIKSLDKLMHNENNEVLLAGTKKKSSPSKAKTACIAVDKYEYVFKEILHEVKVYKKTFYCMTLNDNLVPKEISEIIIPNVFACSRDKILNFQKEYELSMSDLRHAAHATKSFLFRLYLSWHNVCSICEGTFTNTIGVRCKVCDHNLCEECSVFKRLHDHNSWMQCLPWIGKAIKYDLTKWNNFNAKLDKGDVEYDAKFTKLFAHTKICQTGKKCALCMAMAKFFFGMKSARSGALSTSQSTSTGNARNDECNAKCDSIITQ